jgi:hypothetical protein
VFMDPEAPMQPQSMQGVINGWPLMPTIPAPRRILIPQREYTAHAHDAMFIASQSPIEFWVDGRKGIRITDAFNDNFQYLQDASATPLENVKLKVSVRIEVRCCNKMGAPELTDQFISGRWLFALHKNEVCSKVQFHSRKYISQGACKKGGRGGRSICRGEY